MRAVDNAATNAGKTTTDEYIAEWREESAGCDEDIDAVVESEVARIDAAYPRDRLSSYVRNKGWADPAPNAAP